MPQPLSGCQAKKIIVRTSAYLFPSPSRFASPRRRGRPSALSPFPHAAALSSPLPSVVSSPRPTSPSTLCLTYGTPPPLRPFPFSSRRQPLLPLRRVLPETNLPLDALPNLCDTAALCPFPFSSHRRHLLSPPSMFPLLITLSISLLPTAVSASFGSSLVSFEPV